MKTCIVKELLPGKDGYVRTVKVEIPTENGGKRNLIRSLQQLVPLVISVNHDKVKESPKNETAHAPNCSDATQADAAQDNATQANAGLKRNAAAIGETIRCEMYK